MQYQSIGELLAFYLKRNCRLAISWQTNRAEEILQFCQDNQPSLLVSSPNFPDMTGSEMVAKVRERFPAIRIVLYSATVHSQILAEMMEAHVHGIVAAESPLSTLVTAIDVVANGGCFFDSVAESILHRRKTTSDRLTPRERSVLRHVAEGRSTKEIADILGLSVKTIEKFRERLMSKLDIHDAVRLTRFALRAGICSLN